MDLVFCMAGLYSRFRNAGYRIPKYLLPWNGSTVLGEIFRHMRVPNAFGAVALVANDRDQAFRAQIEAEMAKAGIASDRLVFVPDTRGQAETAMLGAELLDRLGLPDAPILFHNVDTVLVGRDFAAIGAALEGADGYIDVFDASSPAYSYVRVDAAWAVTEMAEKVVISSHATTGLYGFRSRARYVEVAKRTAVRGEFYVSDVYKVLLEERARVLINRSSDGHQTIILGTPAEYEAAVRASP